MRYVGISDSDPMNESHYFSRRPSSTYRIKKIETILRGHYLELYTASGVFSRSRVDPGTKILCESMKLPSQGNILDFGTGIGIVAMVAAKESPRAIIYATDINLRAIQLARRNVKLNKISNCNVRNVNEYESFKSEQFVSIVSNPPYSAGWTFVKDMITQSPKYLQTGGTLQLVCLQRKGGRRLKKLLLHTFDNVEILVRKSGYRVFLSTKH